MDSSPFCFFGGWGVPTIITARPTPSPPHANAPKMPKWIEEGIEKFGAITVFVAFVVSGIGLHLSEDLILIPAGWLSANDPRFFWELAAAAYAGIVLGDLGWFLLCRTFGTRLLQSKFFKRHYLADKYNVDPLVKEMDVIRKIEGW